MKSLLFIIASVFISQVSYADLKRIRVTDHICGEIDPFIIGNACLIQGSSDKRNFALIIDMDEYYYSSLADSDTNDIITIDDTYLEKIIDTKTINEVNNYFIINDSKHYYYRLLFPTDSVKSLSKAKVENTFKLNCSNTKGYDDHFMYYSIAFESSLEILSNNTYILSAPSFNYILSLDLDMNDVWASEKLIQKNTRFTNLRTYNPRVYFGHIKFNNIFSRDIFGEVDFILPENALQTTDSEKSFTSYMIMTAMDNHWGGTINLNCTIQKSNQL